MTVATLGMADQTGATLEHRAGAISMGKELYDMLLRQQTLAGVADMWCSADHSEHLKEPVGSTAESRSLREKSPTPILRLIENTLAQTLFVEGYRTVGKQEDAPIWDIAWQQNGLDRRQTPLHHAAIRHGQAYSYVSLGLDPLTGQKQAKIRGYSAKRMVAGYDDPSDDEFPIGAAYVIERQLRNGKVTYLHVLDDHYDNELVVTGDGWNYVGRTPHGSNVVPVTRFTNHTDLEGNAEGEILPFVPIAARIDQTTYDRLVVQRGGAWRVRWATGLTKPETPEGQAQQSMALRVGDLLVNSSVDGKFGTLDPSDMTGYIAAREADIRDLASVSQIPPQYLLGSISNLSADALAAAEATLMRKVAVRKHSFGESWEQTLRIAAHVMGMSGAGSDYTSQVKWADIESRSLAQVADALGKLATMLEIPWEVLVDRIPGWTQQDTKLTTELKAEKQAQQDQINAALLEASAAPPPAPDQPVPPTAVGLATTKPAA